MHASIILDEYRYIVILISTTFSNCFQKLNMGGGGDFDAEAADVDEGNFSLIGSHVNCSMSFIC